MAAIREPSWKMITAPDSFDHDIVVVSASSPGTSNHGIASVLMPETHRKPRYAPSRDRPTRTAFTHNDIEEAVGEEPANTLARAARR